MADVGVVEEATSSVAAPVSTAPLSAPMQEPRRDDRGNRAPGDRDNDRRGGRGRRRGRGGQSGQRSGGRGLPDSKFYSPRGEGDTRPERAPEPRESPRAETADAPESAANTPAYTSSAPEGASRADDFLVLPGEKLSKYRHGAEPAAAAPHIHELESVETPEQEPLAIEADADGAVEMAPEAAEETPAAIYAAAMVPRPLANRNSKPNWPAR